MLAHGSCSMKGKLDDDLWQESHLVTYLYEYNREAQWTTLNLGLQYGLDIDGIFLRNLGLIAHLLSDFVCGDKVLNSEKSSQCQPVGM